MNMSRGRDNWKRTHVPLRFQKHLRKINKCTRCVSYGISSCPYKTGTATVFGLYCDQLLHPKSRLHLKMAFNYKILIILIVVVFLALVQTKPVDESKAVASQDVEIMEVAEGQNPFLPRFAMKRLKQRREQAMAQRRNNQNQNTTTRPHRVRCPQDRYYKK